MNRQGKGGVRGMLPEERPYEKCVKHGPGALTDAELLAAVIRTGTREDSCVELARKILTLPRVGGRLDGISALSMAEFTALRGIGRVKAVQLLCIGELSRRIAKMQAGERLRFDDPASIADYYMEDMRHEPREICILSMLNTKNQLLKDCRLTEGTVNASLISVRDIYGEALRQGAVGIVLLHNHPSGDPTPSGEDVQLTGKLAQAGRLLGISLLDHIIIGDRRYFSMREEGYL